MATRLIAAAASLVTIAGLAQLHVPAAHAAIVFQVETTVDADANGACADSTELTTATPVTLRNALCVADNRGGAVEIVLPAGHYNLGPDGALIAGTRPGADITIRGMGASDTVVIRGNGTDRVIDMDPGMVGGVSLTLRRVTITGGVSDDFGGAGIIGGSNSAQPDVLTIEDSVISDNVANAATPDTTTAPGGGVQFIGGRLTVRDSVISQNRSNGSAGGGIAYGATGIPNEALIIERSTFSANSATARQIENGGAALVIDQRTTATPATMRISDSTFSENAVDSTSGNPGSGAAVWHRGGALTIERSTFTANTVPAASPVGAAAVHAMPDATLTAHYNRFVGAGGPGVQVAAPSGSDLSLNWWSCNGDPGACGRVAAPTASVYTPWLQLSGDAPDIEFGSTTTTVTVSLLLDSSGGAVSAAQLTAFEGLRIGWSGLVGGTSVAQPQSALASGETSVGFTTSGPRGLANVTASLDGSSLGIPVHILYPPTFGIVPPLTYHVGAAPRSVTFSSSGYRSAAISATGLPENFVLTDFGNGTADISGSPRPGQGGEYPLTLRAVNASGSDEQSVTLTVTEAPAFTSSASASTAVGNAASITVTSRGFPAPTLAITGGTLPNGLSVSAVAGSLSISGTPAAGSGGAQSLTIQSSNAHGTATQTLVLTVLEDVSVTKNPVGQQVLAGSTVTFEVEHLGFPVPTVQWQVDRGTGFVDLPDAGSATLTRTVGLGDDGDRFRATLTQGGRTVYSSIAALRVGEQPVFVSSPSAVATANDGSRSISIVVQSTPSATIASSSVPSWATFESTGPGTATIVATPRTGDGGVHSVELTASNGFGTVATQTLTIIVNEAPELTVSGSTRIGNGVAAGIRVTMTGYPAPAFSITGSLPSGVSSVPNGDGSISLVGTPAPGAGGEWPVTLSATNAHGSDTHPMVLVVDEAPTIDAISHAGSVREGDEVVVTADLGGFPAPVPAWSVSRDGGASWTSIAGQPDGTLKLTAASTDDGALFRVTATNSHGTATATAAPLEVRAPLAITSPDFALFEIGQGDAFTVSGSGHDYLVTIDAAPAWITVTQLGADAELRSTATAPATGTVQVRVSNGVDPAITQTLTVVAAARPAATPAGSGEGTVGGAIDLALGLSAVSGTVTVQAVGAMPPGVALQVAPAGDTVTFTGSPAAGAGGMWSFQVELTNEWGLTSIVPVTVTVFEAPSLTSAATATFTRGIRGEFVFTAAGGYGAAPRIDVSSALPAGLTFTDRRDGTAVLAGTTLDAVGDVLLTVTPANSKVVGAAQSFTLRVVDATAVPLPPAGKPLIVASLHGVPLTAAPGTALLVTGTGFAPESPITLGLYSTLVPLGSVVADRAGAFSVRVTLPASITGSHTVVAGGYAPDGSLRYLGSPITLVSQAAPTPPPGPSAGSGTDADPSGGGSLQATGADGDAYGVALGAALLTLLAGILLLMRRRRA
ncbi:beta strand repeat-containing protein [Ruicaihuangia caeni]|uniref:beta strand repeat-containing protein n=1 Tax=Ruicaihuangia caeni TaxID=3042517 RepID=UPI00338F5D25